MENKVIEDCSTCGSASFDEGGECGMECRLKEAMQEVLYYDDEELDVYRGRPSDGYTDQETEEFRYVLETMFPREVSGWVRSLEQRGVAVPDGIKDEVILCMKG